MTGLRTFDWNDQVTGKVAELALEMEPGMLYKASVSNPGSIRGHAMVDSSLLLIQTTVGDAPRAASISLRIEAILKRAREKEPGAEPVLVYVAVAGAELAMPACTSLAGRVKACV